MYLSLDERIHHATTMRQLYDKTCAMFEGKVGLKIDGKPDKKAGDVLPAKFIIQVEGGYVDLHEAVFASIDGLLDSPPGYEFSSLDLFSHQYLIDLMLHTMRDNGVEADGKYFIISRSLFKLAEMEEAKEIAEEEDDADLF